MKKENILTRFLNRKESASRTVSTIRQIGTPISSPANYQSFSQKGYQANAMVYVCINKIAQAVGGVEWCLYTKKKDDKGKRKEITDHPLINLIQQPNPLQGQSAFFEAYAGFYLISGNTYVEANKPFENKPPAELWIARSDRMKIIGGTRGYPAAYQYEANGYKKTFDVDPIKLTSNILHVKSFNPLSDWYGQSPLQAGLMALDQNNEANTWNLAMLQNSASPAGIFTIGVTNSNPKGELSKEKYDRLKNEIEETYQGAKNAGRPMLGEGGLTWQQMSLSPKDMDFLNNRNVSAEDICRIYGVPSEIVGLGQKTFSNYKEANLAFHLQTVLPFLKGVRYALNKWLVPAFGDDLYLDFNADDIDAIAQFRLDQYTNLQAVNFLTLNEKRAAAKYEEREGWDVFVVGNQIGAMPEDFSGGSSGAEPGDETIPEKEKPAKPGKKTPSPDDSDEEDEDTKEASSFAEFKTFNLINQNERQKSLKRQNARRKRLEASFNRDVREDFNKLNDLFLKAADQVRNPSSLEYALIKESSDFMPKMRKTIERHERAIMEEFGIVILNEGKSTFKTYEIKANLKYDSYVRDFVKKRSGEAIVTIQSTNQKKVHQIVKRLTETALENGETNPEFAKELIAEFDGLSQGRARTIARTETQIASSNASREAVKSLGIPNMEKEWVSQMVGNRRDGGENGDLPNHQIMNGQSIPLDEKFSVPPDADMDGPGDPGSEASQIVNCTCVLVYRSRN